MPTLLFQFLGHRYHATPWGHHVNEGHVEWPPSPWRLLRALLAVGYTHLHWDDAPPEVGASLLRKLASALPSYRLPRATGAHSRHYMPIGEMKDGVERTTLVFDTWAHVGGDDTLAVRWDVELDSEERTLLAKLAAHMNYLGRSESWVEASVAPDTVSGFDVVPGSTAPHQRGWEQVSLMAPLADSEYEAWRNEMVERAKQSSGVDLTKAKLTAADKKKLQAVEAPFPASLLDCLQAETSWLRAQGWNQAPGSRKVFYWRRGDALEVGTPVTQPKPKEAEPIELLLLAIASNSRSKGVLPHINRAVAQAELLHRALVSRSTQLQVFTGCDDARQPLRGAHQHAHILPLDLDGDQHLDHVLLWAPMGFDGAAQSAVRAVRKTYSKNVDDALQLMVVAGGDAEGLLRLAAPIGPRLARFTGAACTWTSVTPFVPPRYLKKTGKNALEGQVQAELTTRGFPPASIAVRNPRDDDTARRARHVVRSRTNGPRPPQDCSFVIDLTFERPVRGPIALGYGAHFGLGVFAAVDD